MTAFRTGSSAAGGRRRQWGATPTPRGRRGALIVAGGLASTVFGALLGIVVRGPAQGPFVGVGMAAILVGGALVVHAIVRAHERSPLVLLALVPVLLVLFLVGGEIVGGH